MSEYAAKVSAVLFDMDGVLVDSRAVIEQAWREAAQLYGREITEDDIHRHIHGQPGPHTIRALFHDLSRADQEKVQAHIIHVENTADCEPISGVARLVSRLGAAGITIGVVTSGWRYKIDRVIEMLKAQSYFSVIVERDDVARGKPYPDPYLLAAERLGVPASRTVVFEDASSGVTSAATAGAYCVGIGGEELIRSGAKIAIPDFEGVELETIGSQGSILSCRPGHQLFVERLAARPR
ncbi:HAD family phosphatase [Caballeronia novacaledonica]|uniref:HAD family hydrolase n=1 Tax=Caballeronia novacaledonica TaxID=1544861 RepID=UPI001EE22680|nr:HAD family phosphatase [Caballeronia novacaledonica]GJH13227.1 HAD family phosphatase [Caballeronia novacaledonica]